jgi:hypothetical protein
MTRREWHVFPSLVVTVSLLNAGTGSASSTGGGFSDWSAPVNLGAPVNSGFEDAGPAISRDGRSLYFGSTRPGGSGAFDLWVSTRRSTRDPWGTPANLGPVVNSGFVDNVPALSPDEHWLFFNSNRPGGFGDSDLWVSWRPRVHDDFGWQAPVNLGPTINTPFFDAGASLVRLHDDCDDHGEEDDDQREEEEGALMMFYGSQDDIYVSLRGVDGSFGPRELVPEVTSPFVDARPHVSRDGREMILQSNGPVTEGILDLFTSFREGVCDSWAEPVNLGPVINGPARDFQPYLTKDRKTLYFSSDRTDGMGGQDLYLSTRTKQPRQE